MSRGQITEDTPFGHLLALLALHAKVIVEIGTMTGEGSTRCLHSGMLSPDQKLIGIDVCKESVAEARKRYERDPRVTIMQGSVVPSSAFVSFPGHPHKDGEGWWHAEKAAIENAPMIDEGALPPAIDLLLIDGGEFGADYEFAALAPRSKVIALDDTFIYKNKKNRQRLLKDPAWEVIADMPQDRHGWFISRRKP